jgi:type II secretory pathway component PulJ
MTASPSVEPLENMSEQEQCDGFSLIDMLVALVLLAIISGLMLAFIGQFRVLQRLRTDISAKMELDALTGYLQDTIGGAMPLPFLDNQPDTRFVFEGTKSRLRFTTIARQGVQSFGLRETALALEGQGDRQTLVQDFYPRRLDEQERTAATATIELAANITTLKFEYLSYDAKTRAPIWSEDWLARNGLPAAVRFDFTSQRNGKVLQSSGQAVVNLAEEPQATTQPGT